MFGADVDNRVANQRLTEIPSLSDAYEEWYRDWLGILTFVEDSRLFTRRVFDIYYYSARLYLFSHIFRGQASDERNSKLSNHVANNGETFVDAAIQSALSIVCLITKEAGLQNLPYYIGTVTAFASLCLVKASGQSELITCDKDGNDISVHLGQLVQVLQPDTTTSSTNGNDSSHPLQGIADSLERILAGELVSCDTEPLNGGFGFDFALGELDMLSGDFEQSSNTLFTQV